MYQIFKRTRKAANRSSTMEAGDHLKNGGRPKNQKSREYFLLFSVLMLSLFAFTNRAMGQTWNIGHPGYNSNVKATLNGNTLTISGTGNMVDFLYSTEGQTQWRQAGKCSSIQTVVIESGVTNIGDVAFQDCNNLQWITIPEGVKIIGRRAFENCSSLTAFHIPSSVAEIESQAFKGCSGLTVIWNRATTPQTIDATIFEGVSLSGKYLAVAPESINAYKSKSVWRNFTVVSQSMLLKLDGKDEFNRVVFDLDGQLQYYKFQDNNPNILEKLVVFDGNTYIGQTEIPKLVVDYNLDGKPKRYMANDGTKILIDGYGNNTFNATLVTTSGATFSVENISYNISDITNNFSIEEYLTKVTDKMYNATIHKFMEEGTLNAAEIVGNAFKDEFLKRVFTNESMPDEIKVGYRVLTFVKEAKKPAISCGFANAASPFLASIPYVGWAAVAGAYLYCLYDLYKVAKATTDLSSSLYDMFHNKNNTSCTVSADLTGGTLTIYGTGALCSDLLKEYANRKNEVTSLIIGGQVTSIPTSAFSGFNNLTSVTIGNGPEPLVFADALTTSSINRAFYNSSIGTLYLNRNISYNGSYSPPFEGNVKLTKLEIGNNVTSIGADCFKGCTGLTSITFGSGLTSIGNNAFSDCTNLKSIAINSRTSIGNSSFSGCSILTSANISGVTTIGKSAFHNSGLTKITIPGSVTSIGYSAFSECNALQSVTIENGPEPLVFADALSTSSFYRAFYNSSIGTLYLNRNISYNGSYSPPFEGNLKSASEDFCGLSGQTCDNILVGSFHFSVKFA